MHKTLQDRTQISIRSGNGRMRSRSAPRSRQHEFEGGIGSMLICSYFDIHDNYTYLQITCTVSPYPHNLTC
jgi:hypothetical protein